MGNKKIRAEAAIKRVLLHMGASWDVMGLLDDFCRDLETGRIDWEIGYNFLLKTLREEGNSKVLQGIIVMIPSLYRRSIFNGVNYVGDLISEARKLASHHNPGVRNAVANMDWKIQKLVAK